MNAGYVDIHHHLLFGMDDGPAVFETTEQMLHRLVSQGIRYVVATPHAVPGIEPFDSALYHQRLQEVRRHIRTSGLPLHVIAGAEILYSSSTPSLIRDGKLPLLGNSWYTLVEFPPSVSWYTIQRAATEIGNAGYGMVLAHAERYPVLRWRDRLSRLRDEYHVKIQMNCDTILESHRSWHGYWIRRAMRAGLVDMIASDAHDLQRRPCRMRQCAELVAKVYGQNTAQRLFYGNAMALLTERGALGTDSEGEML